MNYDFGRPQSQQHHQQKKNGPDPYEILNLDRNVDQNAIRNRFRTLTRLHHPDRNRRNPNYDPRYYATICSAYEILSDPQRKAAYDNAAPASWEHMKAAQKQNQIQVPSNQDIQTNFQTRSQFGEGDIRKFNEAFEKHRKMDPNDRGYGDMMVAERITEQEAKSGSRRPVEAPRNVFGSTKVSGAAFNDRFQSEIQTKRRTTSSLQERGEGEPLGWFGGHSGSDISMFDGVIVNQEQNDFSRVEGGVASLQYADYMAGFDTITEQLPENHPYLTASGDLKKAFEERLTQKSQIPDTGPKRSFAESELVFQKQRENTLAAEQERNRQIVLRYRDQYASQDLLPSATTRGGGTDAINQAMANRNFFQPAGQRRF